MNKISTADDQISELIGKHRKLAALVDERIKKVFDKKMYPMIRVTHRIKTPESVRGKLERKPDKYPTASQLRDILGFRVICFFQEDIDNIAKKIEEVFRVDHKLSTDKRELIAPTSFGYVSLHCICALPEDEGYPDDMCQLWFEIQIRTMLQHVWAEIEHDLGYKSEFGVPRAVRRNFSRAAGLLETADEIFTDIKHRLTEYKQEVIRSIENDNAAGLYLDAVTITEFTARSKKYQSLLEEIAAITGARISEANPETQLPQLAFLEIHTLDDLVAMLDREHDMALGLAQKRLKDSGLEELTSTVAYYYLYRAVLINNNFSPERLKEFFALTSNNSKLIERNTERILKERLSQNK